MILLALLAQRTPAVAGPVPAIEPGEAPLSGEEPAAPPADPHALHPLPNQLSSMFAIDPRNPEAHIPGIKERNRNPLEFGYFLQDLLEQAEQARKKNDFPGVISYYRAVAKAVPDNAKGWSKLCEAYEAVKDRDRAIKACKYAIDRPAVELQDYIRYVRLILSTDQAVSPTERAELAAVIAHLEGEASSRADVPLKLVASELRCQVGVKTKDVALLEMCTKVLNEAAPKDPKTVVFRWSLAMMKGQRAEAERLVDLARESGVVLENVERMEKVTSGLGGSVRRAIIVAGVALLLGLLVYMVRQRRRAVSQQLARAR